MSDPFAYASYQRDERSGRNEAVQVWEDGVTVPFGCSVDVQGDCESERQQPRGPHVCVGATASAANPARRYVTRGHLEWVTGAECCGLYDDYDDECRSQLDEEAGGKGAWLDDGRFDNRHFLCEACYENWRIPINAEARPEQNPRPALCGAHS